MSRRSDQDAHLDLCRRLATALNERDAARAEVERLRVAVRAAPQRLLVVNDEWRFNVLRADLDAALDGTP